MRKSIILVILIIALASTAYAGSISITTRTDTIVMVGNSTNFNVTISNSGDEAAHDVTISLLLPDGFSSKSVFAGRIDPNSEYTATFNVVTVPRKDGVYSFAILVEYKDANQYPFSAVSPSTIIYNTPSSSLVTAVLQRGTVSTRGSTIMSISNLDDKPHEVDMRLYLPKELSSLEAQKNISLEAGENRQETFVIDNRGALERSSYAVFAVLSYEDENQHYSHTTSNVIIIGVETTTTQPQGGNLDVKTGDVLIIGLIIIIVAIIIYNLKVKGWKRKEEKHGENTSPENSQ